MSNVAKYFGDWSSYADVVSDVSPYGYDDLGKYVQSPPPAFPTEDEIMLARYEIDGYEGMAVVIYCRDGKLYEWVGSHCSCNGLSDDGDMWAGSEVSYEYLKNQINRPSMYLGHDEAPRNALETSLELWDFDEPATSGVQ